MKPNRKEKRITVYFTPVELERLSDAAAENDCTVSAFVRGLWVAYSEAKREAEQQAARAWDDLDAALGNLTAVVEDKPPEPKPKPVTLDALFGEGG